MAATRNLSQEARTMPKLTPDAKRGKALRLARVKADIKAKDIAELMGVTPQRVSQFERAATPDAAARYTAALEQLTGR